MGSLTKHGRLSPGIGQNHKHSPVHRPAASARRQQLALVLCSTLALLHLPSLTAAQSTSPISSVPADGTSGTDAQLQVVVGFNRPNPPRYNVIALAATAQVRQATYFTGNAKQIFPNNTGDITSSTFAFISCDSSSPTSNSSGPIDSIAQAISRNAAATLLYSNVQAGCNFISGGSINPDYNRIYTLTSPQGNGTLFQSFSNSSMAVLAQKGVLDANSTAGSAPAPGSGNTSPSPSTAVAMIILYSITGVITALFLIIIVTGAVRAHRHPERYGPRNALGRPRQSRARGLARAMLETLPIVKFGEEDENKPNDVELAGAAAAATAAEGKTARDSTLTEAEGEKAADGEAATGASATGEAVAAKAADTPAAAAKPEEALGCSICTDDFEKGQDVRVLPCGHHFHPACIDPWLLNVSGTCPLCRIDLRPAADDAGNSTTNGESFPPPLDSTEQARRVSRRHSLIWDVLNPNRMREAGPQERLAALRRVREARSQSQTEEVEARRRRRLTARLQDVFHIRTATSATAPPEAAATPTSGVTTHRASTIGRIAEAPGETDGNEITESPANAASTPASDWPVSMPAAKPETSEPASAAQPATEKESEDAAASAAEDKISSTTT